LELVQGRDALLKFPGGTPDLVDRLVAAGLFSPLRIVRAGAGRLAGVAGIAEPRPPALLDGAQARVAEPGAAVRAAAPSESDVEADHPETGERGPNDAAYPGTAQTPGE